MTTELIESTYTQLATELTTQTTLLSILSTTLDQVKSEPESGFRNHLITVLEEQLEKAQALVSEWSKILTRKICEPTEDQLGLKAWREVSEAV